MRFENYKLENGISKFAAVCDNVKDENVCLGE